MTSETPSLTIGELEANYSLYCKAMRLLIIEGRSLKKIQRTVCWQRLEILHNCLPHHDAVAAAGEVWVAVAAASCCSFSCSTSRLRRAQR